MHLQEVAAVFKGRERGASWQLLSTIKSGNNTQEVTISKEMDTVFVMAPLFVFMVPMSLNTLV